MPGEGLTHGPPANKMQAAGTTGAADQPAFPARCLTAYTSSPRGPALLPPSPTDHHHQLGLSVGRPGPYDFAVRTALFVGACHRAAIRYAHRLPAPRLVTIAIRPSCRGRMRGK